MPCLTDEQLAHFDEEGYLLVRGMLDVDEVIQPIIDEYHAVLDQARSRTLPSWTDRIHVRRLALLASVLTQIVVDSGQIHGPVLRLLPAPDGHRCQHPLLGPGLPFFAVLPTPDLLDVVESIVGPEIWSNPVQHVRLKPPERLVPKKPQRPSA